MSTTPRAFLALDQGTATTAVALIVRVGATWRLAGASSAPAAVEPEAVAERIRGRLAAADPALARELRLDRAGAVADLPRSTCHTVRPAEMAVIAATRRVLDPLATAAETAGWRVRRLVLDGAEILPVATTLADPRVSAILAGSSDPPGADERGLLPDLAAVVAAATDRRPDLPVVLAGGLAGPDNRVEPLLRPERPGATVLAPSPLVAHGDPLRELLDRLRGPEDDGRRALVRATATLAEVLQRRVELVEIGQAGATRAIASWRAGRSSPVRFGVVPAAALLPASFTDAHLDAIGRWLASPFDRLRVRDRLRELSLAPWGDAAGNGALLRMAAARAAVERLVAATPYLEPESSVDVIVAAGGAWSVAPGPAVALALADTLRRPGVRAMGWDHARLLAPLGAIEDDDERRRVMADLRDDLLVPLGSVVMPAGLRAGHRPGRLTIATADGPSELELAPGGLQLVDLPPGERAVVELRFRDTVDLGVRVRHAAVEVAGGLAGLLVDLRDVPMRLPDRPERRRDLLGAWQSALWSGMDA